MMRVADVVLFGLVCLLLIPVESTGQTSEQVAGSSLGLHCGYFFPVGEWSQSRIAPDVRLFAGNVGFSADIELRIAERWTLGLSGSYTSPNTSDWEDYARAKGGALNIHASLTTLGLILRPHLLLSADDVVRIELGVAGLWASGSETWEGSVYQYDFFPTFTIGGQGGVEYLRLLSPRVALSLRVVGMVFPSGVQYVDGESLTVIAMPVTAGIRFLL